MVNNITPINLWVNGSTITATQLSVTGIMDDFETSATIYYQLLDVDGVQVSQGNLSLDGQQYIDWSSVPDANTWICEWTAQQLNITII